MALHVSPARSLLKMKEQETAVISLEGNHLSLMGSKLGELPSFKYKKHGDKDVVDFITSVDASVNKLMYGVLFLHGPWLTYVLIVTFKI